MKNQVSNIVLLLSVLILAATVIYLNSTGGLDTESATLWTTGKIFVVVGVLSTIFIGIIIFLLHLERKISDLESRHKP